MQGKEFKYVGALSADYVIRSMRNERTGKDENWMLVRGYASDTGWDKLNGKVYPNAVYGMVRCVNDGAPTPIFRNDRAAQNPQRHDTVGIDVDHSTNWTDQIGRAVYSKVVEEVPDEMLRRGMKPQPPLMYVEFEVDLEMSHGRDFKRALDRGDQLGLSIYGKVTDGYREWVDRAKGQYKDHFHMIDLEKIAITSQPVNNATFTEVVHRSLTGVKMEELESQEAAQPSSNGDEAAPAEVSEEAASNDAAAETEAVEEGVEVAAPEHDGSDDSQVEQDAQEGAGDEPVAESNEAGAEEAVEGSGDPEPVEETPAAESESDPAPAPEEALEPDALADLAAVGAVTLETPAAQPEVESSAETAQLPEAQTEVARSETFDVTSLVENTVFRAFETETRDVVGGMSETISRALEDITALRSTVEKQAEQITSLTKALAAYSAEGVGRKGAMIMRSLSQEDSDAARKQVPLGWELEKEQRERIMKELVLQGQAHVATAMMMGWLKQPEETYAYKDPLLPGNSRKNAGAEGAMIIDGEVAEAHTADAGADKSDSGTSSTQDQ